MNDEYLWNKTGTDAEIEEIENSLKSFRFSPNDPPALPGTVLTLSDKKWPFNFFKVGLAVAFAAALIIAMSVIFLRSPKVNRTADQPEISGITSPNFEDPGSAAPPSMPIVDLPMPKPKIINVTPSTTNATRAVKVKAKKDEKITPEEKHAYDQLMLALAITSNELKFVKDKINGRDERTDVRDRQK